MGIPFAIAIWVTGTMLKNLGHSDTEATLITGGIGIAWSLKPFWASFLDMYRTKKFFVLSMEVVLALLLFAFSAALRLPTYMQLLVPLLWVMAFASATQDICADGIYITALDKEEQDSWIGIQGAGWNAGRVFATGAIVGLAGYLTNSQGHDKPTAWFYAFGACGIAMAVLAVYHSAVLPTGALVRRPESAAAVARTFANTVVEFFKKKSIWGMLIFVFLYRSGEGLLLVEAPLFMQASTEQGGLGLPLEQKGLVDGTVGTIASIVAGILAGRFIAKTGGLKKNIIFLALCMNIPHVCYIILSQLTSPGHPPPLWEIYVLATVEKFGYSFGFVGNMLYMMQQIAPGKYKMAHYAFATALMNLVLVPTQSASGWLADKMGYKTYFIFVLLASIPSIIAAWKAPFPDPQDVEVEGDEAAPGAAPA